MAAMLVGRIRRKVVKQTVMTSVLGGTRHGAKDKVARRLKEFSILPEALSGKQRQQVAAYLVDLIFDSQAGLFQGAQLIQKWLHSTTTEIGQAVSPANAPLVQRAMNNKVKESSVTRAIRFLVRSVTGTEDFSSSGDVADSRAVYPQTSLQWTTLLGLPVMLPYRKTKLTRVHTALQDVHLNLTSPLDRVDVGKQANSMAPNFIHSLDSTHMLMTAEACAENDIDFAAVHDCFWTHAGRVDDMNALLRQSFVDLHSQSILERLRAEFIARYQNHVVPLWSFDEKQLRDDGHHQFHRHRDPSRRRIVGWRPVRIQPLPQVGAFNISEVLRAKYFFC
jgi:DNA-directed RNA polymerase